MELLKESEKKLNYAEFLLSRDDSQPFAQGALNHVLTAATLILKSLTDLDAVEIKSPKLVQQTLNRFEEAEPKAFAKFYMRLLKTATRESVDAAEVMQDLRTVKKFLFWAKEHKIQ